MARLELTTNPGLEDVALDELRQLAPEADVRGTLRPNDLAGHVHVECELGDPAFAAIGLRMRSIHRLVRPIHEFELRSEPLAEIQRTFAELAPTIPELEPPDTSFRVTSARHGTHDFTSEDAARVAGAGVRDAMLRPVKLKGGDVELRCDVHGPRVRVGIHLSAKSLSRRAHGPFRPSTSLRPNFAFALAWLARPPELPPPVHLLDPFCGAATILSEAAAQWPSVHVYGSDLHTMCVDGARQNLGDRATVRLGDARDLAAVWPDVRVDTIVTNPPFGRRLATETDLSTMYRSFLEGAARISTDDARLVALVERRGAFNKALRGSGWETRHVRIVELGGLHPGIFVLGRSS